jgi:hypothetical protein
VPKSTSETRSRFYKSNQLVMSFPDAFSPEDALPLSLVALWNIDSDSNYLGLTIACPVNERPDKSVDCYWIAPWADGEPVTEKTPAQTESSEEDLDEVRPHTRGPEDIGS